MSADKNPAPPMKPRDDGEECFPKTIQLEDGTQLPVGLPPGVDPEQAKLAIAYLQQNPILAKNAAQYAERLSKTPGMSQQMAQIQQAMMTRPEFKKRMEVLKDDPELKPIFDEITRGGMSAIDKYWNDRDLMSKISKRMEAMEIEIQPKKDSARPVNNLHDAARVGDLESIKKFIDQGDNVNEQDQRGITPLGVAVGFNRLEAVRYFLTNGADFSLTDKQGNTVLHYAAGYGRVEIAEVLIASGADMEHQNNSGKKPLDVATMNGETGVINFLKEKLAG